MSNPRALFWSETKGFVQVKPGEKYAYDLYTGLGFLEVTGDLEDEAAFQREQTGETDEDE